MAPEIPPDVTYRIQNVDLGTFLERHDKTTLVMRPEKESTQRNPTLKQQWYFRSVSGSDNIYEILNAYDKQYVLNAKPGPPSGGGGGTGGKPPTYSSQGIAFGTVTIAKNAPTRWRIEHNLDHRIHSHYLIAQGDNLGDDDVLLAVGSDGRAGLAQDENIQDPQRINKDDDFQWRLLEVNPAELPEGDGEKYRIRTFAGMAIGADKGALNIKNQNRGDHRSWEIKSQGNGRCTIRNVKDNVYLNYERRGGQWVIALTPNPPQKEHSFIIASTSELTHSISVLLDLDGGSVHPHSFSLSMDEQNVILKLSKAAHNQIWLIEAEDAYMDRGGGGTGGGGTGGKGEPQVVAGRLREGEYTIRQDASKAINFKLGNALSAKLESQSFELQIKKDGSSGEITISRDSDGTTYYLGIQYGAVTVSRNSFLWGVQEQGNRYVVYNGADYLGTRPGNTQPVVLGSSGGNDILWSFNLE